MNLVFSSIVNSVSSSVILFNVCPSFSILVSNSLNISQPSSGVTLFFVNEINCLNQMAPILQT